MFLKSILATCSVLFFANITVADTVLKIKSISNGEQMTVAELSMSDLDAMDQTTYVTANAFLESPAKFSGPLLRDVLALYNLTVSDEITITALNDYSIQIPFSDALDHEVILATKLDDKVMSVRDKGPIWLMYPVSKKPEIDNTIYESRMIWQMISITLQ